MTSGDVVTGEEEAVVDETAVVQTTAVVTATNTNETNITLT